MVGLAFLLLLFGVWRAGVALRLGSEVAAIRNAGYRVVFEEARRWVGSSSVPDERDQATADLYRKAFDLYQRPTGAVRERVPLLGSGQLPERSESLPRKMEGAIEQFLESNRQMLKLLRTAAKQTREASGQRVVPSIRDDVHPPVPISKCTIAVKMFVLRAFLCIERGEVKQAVEAIRDGWTVAGALEHEPSLTPMLIGGSNRIRTVKWGVERLLNHNDVPLEILLSLAEIIVEPNHGERWGEMVTEWMVGMAAEAGQAKGQILHESNVHVTLLEQVEIPKGVANWIYWRAGLLDLDLLNHLEFLQRARKWSGAPLSKRLERCAGREKRIKEGATWTQWSKIRFSEFREVLHLQAIMVANVRLAQAGFAIQRYRLTKGRRPDELAEVVPRYLASIPVDPFTDKPLMYEKLPTGFRVYSVGQDGKEDDGSKTSRDVKGDSPGNDIRFTIRR